MNWSKAEIDEAKIMSVSTKITFIITAPLCVGFIKERMLDKDSDMSRIVDWLFEKGLLTRKENPEDRRKETVEITDKGLHHGHEAETKKHSLGILDLNGANEYFC